MTLDITHDGRHGIGNIESFCIDNKLGMKRRLIGRADAGKLRDLAGSGFLIESLGIAFFAGCKIGLDIDLVECGAPSLGGPGFGNTRLRRIPCQPRTGGLRRAPKPSSMPASAG